MTSEGNVSRLRSAPLAAITVLALSAGSGALATPAGAATKKPATLTVLVTNDDGVAAPGLDALVEALRAAKNTKVVVVAPADNKSGTGSSTTPGTLITAPAKTVSGYDATAVQGFPADTITAALDQLGIKPNVVMSGINPGANFGAVVDLSGTVGAAKMAARRGIPAVAFSQGTGDAPQYASTGKIALAWLARHRTALAKKPKSPPTTIDNYNVPNCPSGKSRGVKTVTTATDLANALATPDCSSTLTKPTTDIEAFNAGYAALATVPAAVTGG
jgi:5'-nucleotidase